MMVDDLASGQTKPIEPAPLEARSVELARLGPVFVQQLKRSFQRLPSL
jgi:hypothetical protein